jgi:phosphoribosylaminoimidazolecarboxamide formyltransferase/IMP cyclohydrolase
MLDGRVKTLHPVVHGGLLHKRSDAAHVAAVEAHGIGPIDMVVVNLYAFEKTAAKPGVGLEELIENIDIGGPSMLRSGAKNFEDVAVVTDVADYPRLVEEMRANGGKLGRATRWELARKVYATTAAYDAAIASTLEQRALETHVSEARHGAPGGDRSQQSAAVETHVSEARHGAPGDKLKAGSGAPGVGAQEELPSTLRIIAPRKAALRYGENPHQRAAVYTDGSGQGIANAEQLQGKELSYNNLVDLDACWALASEFEQVGVAIIKHTNPCGVGLGATVEEAYKRALEADPLSAFGGVIGINREVDEAAAKEIAKLFVEAIVAPGFTEGALGVFAAKKNLRLLRIQPKPAGIVVKQISGGYLAQDEDRVRVSAADLKVMTERQPSEAEVAALLFAWTVCKHVKSNAIVYAREQGGFGQTVGVGAGQMSRVDAAKFGAMKAVLPLAGTVAASDAFFPFPDGLEAIAAAGATAVILQGGSVKDADVIAAAKADSLREWKKVVECGILVWRKGCRAGFWLSHQNVARRRLNE